MQIYRIGFVILAAILWGISGGMAGILMDRGWDPLVISFYRGVVGLVCILVWFLFQLKKNVSGNKALVLWAIVAGAGVAGNFTFYFISISETSVAVAATLMYTAPIFVFLISFLFQVEQSTWFKWVSIAFVMIGIMLLTGVYRVDAESISLLGLVAGLGAGLSYALFIFGFKHASAKGRPQTVLSIAFLSFTILMSLLVDHREAVSVLSSEDLFLFVLLGLFGAGVSFFLYIVGLKGTSPTVASIVAMVEPVTASLFGLLVLSETLTFVQLIGMMIILITVTVLSTRQS